METFDVVAGFLTGLASSLHCIGVCSGISLALLTPTSAGSPAWVRLASAHGGRMLGYTLGGAAVGLGGHALSTLLALAGLNQLLRWFAAAIMVWTGLSIAGWVPAPRLADRWLARLAPVRAVAARGPLGPVLTGLGWSLMPCGMVYLALLNASFTGSPVRGASYMAAFALGTMPALGLASWGVSSILSNLRSSSLGGPGRLVLGLTVVTLAPLTLLAANYGAFETICKGL